MKLVECVKCGKGFEVFRKLPEEGFVCVVCRHKPEGKKGLLTQEERGLLKDRMWELGLCDTEGQVRGHGESTKKFLQAYMDVIRYRKGSDLLKQSITASLERVIASLEVDFG